MRTDRFPTRDCNVEQSSFSRGDSNPGAEPHARDQGNVAPGGSLILE